jgi:DNA-binding NarL/FixJ family response regulator
MKKISVLICDDHSIVRSAMKCLLETADDVQVVGEAENGHSCVKEVRRLRPDVVIMDIAMPLLNGMEAARQISKAVPKTKILVVSSYGDEEHVHQVIKSGAAGYLLKQSAADDLLEAVRETYRGNVFFSPTISRHLARPAGSDLPEGQIKPKVHEALTLREAEILQLIAESYPNKQIADILSLSTKTIEKHRQSLMQKLGIHGIAALTRYAMSCGAIEPAVAGVPVANN